MFHMPNRPTSFPAAISWPLIVFPSLKLIVHLVAIRGYGIFRDELYYIACSDRLAWGYVDHPPLSIAILRLTREVLGDSVIAMRIVPAIAGALIILIVGLIARALGGDRRAEALAMVTALAVPLFWGVGHIYSMNVFDGLIWSNVALLTVWLVQASDAGDADRVRRLWIALGALLGLGLLNKLSVLWLGLGLGIGILLTRDRRWIRTPGPWCAAGIAGLLFLPHILWQIRNDWPTREFIANATRQKMVEVSTLDFLRGQVDMLSGIPIAVVALAGLAWLLVGAGRRYRILGWIYVTVFALLLVNGASRAGYLAPAYTWLFAGGAIAATGLLDRIARTGPRRVVTVTLASLIAIRGILALPFALPILSAERFVAYARALGVEPSTEERKEIGSLPQFYADMHGWQAKADAATRVFESLSSAEREVACFWSWNYGVASAVAYLGGENLPPSLSGHNNYWLWGPGVCTGEVLIVMGGRAEGLRERFATVEEATRVDCDLCMPYEDDMPIFIARGPDIAFADAWPALKHFD